MEINICLCLSHKVSSKGELSLDSLARIRKASEVFLDNNSNFLITTGWRNQKKFNSSLADFMAQEAVKSYKIPESKIIKEERCKDTVGEALFTKLYISENIQFSTLNLFIVTSDWHINRAKEIFDFFYVEKNINLKFISIQGEKIEAEQELLNNSIKEFRSMMTNSEPGNTLNALELIKKQHKLYI